MLDRGLMHLAHHITKTVGRTVSQSLCPGTKWSQKLLLASEASSRVRPCAWHIRICVGCDGHWPSRCSAYLVKRARHYCRLFVGELVSGEGEVKVKYEVELERESGVDIA
jgi:hypothetical protein